MFTNHPRLAVAAAIRTLPKRLQVVSVQVYGTEMKELLDSGAVPNIMNESVASQLSLSPKLSLTEITVANGQKTTFLGAIEDLPVSFNSTIISLNSLVVEGSPVGILIGCRP